MHGRLVVEEFDLISGAMPGSVSNAVRTPNTDSVNSTERSTSVSPLSDRENYPMVTTPAAAVAKPKPASASGLSSGSAGSGLKQSKLTFGNAVNIQNSGCDGDSTDSDDAPLSTSLKPADPLGMFAVCHSLVIIYKNK